MDEDVRNLIIVFTLIANLIGGFLLYNNWSEITANVDSQAVQDFFNIKTYD